MHQFRNIYHDGALAPLISEPDRTLRVRATPFYLLLPGRLSRLTYPVDYRTGHSSQHKSRFGLPSPALPLGISAFSRFAITFERPFQGDLRQVRSCVARQIR